MYLLFATETAANNRADKEGQRRNLGHWTGKGLSRRVSSPRKTKAGKYALPVDGYELTEYEQGKVVTEVEWPEETDL